MRATRSVPPRISRATDWNGTMLMPRPDATIDLMISTFSVSATIARLDVGRDEELVDDAARVRPVSNRMNG